jgi:hypothetical protein
VTPTINNEDKNITLKYEYYRVDDAESETLIAGASGATYKLSAEDIGYKIKVVASAEGYEGDATETTTEKVAKAAVTVSPTVYITTSKLSTDLSSYITFFSSANVKDEDIKADVFTVSDNSDDVITAATYEGKTLTFTLANGITGDTSETVTGKITTDLYEVTFNLTVKVSEKDVEAITLTPKSIKYSDGYDSKTFLTDIGADSNETYEIAYVKDGETVENFPTAVGVYTVNITCKEDAEKLHYGTTTLTIEKHEFTVSAIGKNSVTQNSALTIDDLWEVTGIDTIDGVVPVTVTVADKDGNVIGNNSDKTTVDTSNTGDYTITVALGEFVNGDADSYIVDLTSTASLTIKAGEAPVIIVPSTSNTNTETTTTTTNASGNTVTVTTTTTKDETGAVIGTTEKSEIANIAADTSASVTVNKNASGTITAAAADVSTTVSTSKLAISGAVVSQLTEAAGTKDVQVTVTAKDESGNTKFTVKADADELTAGNKLKIYVLKDDGTYEMVNAKTYTVTKAGNVSVSMTENKTYELVTEAEANAINKQIKATVKVAKSSASVKKGKKTTFKMSSKLNMNNVKKITYSSTKKSVATVNKNGKVTAKKKGTATVKAKVTLKNGTTKTVSMKIKVK